MFQRLELLLLACVVLAVGCGPKVPPRPQVTPADEAKAALQRAAQDGQVGSDILALQGYFEEMKKTEPAKAEALLKDLNILIPAGTSVKGGGAPKVKAKAKEMLEKLNKP